MSTSERTVRGYSHLLLARYIEERLPPEASAKIRTDLAEVWRHLPSVKEDSAASFDDWVAMLRAISQIDPRPEDGYQRVHEAGLFVANHALTTALRLLVRFLRPSIFARKLVDLWRRDHNFGSLDARMGEEPNTMIAELTGVDGYPYVAPLSAGWAVAALTTMGCKEVTWRETLHPLPAAQDGFDHYILELKWQ